MDVSKSGQLPSAPSASSDAPELPGSPESSALEDRLGGEKLVQAVVSLSGLPERDAHDELDRILELSGTSTGELTLEGLRAAMLAYLETLAESMPPECEGLESDHRVHDA